MPFHASRTHDPPRPLYYYGRRWPCGTPLRRSAERRSSRSAADEVQPAFPHQDGWPVHDTVSISFFNFLAKATPHGDHWGGPLLWGTAPKGWGRPFGNDRPMCSRLARGTGLFFFFFFFPNVQPTRTDRRSGTLPSRATPCRLNGRLLAPALPKSGGRWRRCPAEGVTASRLSPPWLEPRRAFVAQESTGPFFRTRSHGAHTPPVCLIALAIGRARGGSTTTHAADRPYYNVTRRSLIKRGLPRRPTAHEQAESGFGTTIRLKKKVEPIINPRCFHQAGRGFDQRRSPGLHFDRRRSPPPFNRFPSLPPSASASNS